MGRLIYIIISLIFLNQAYSFDINNYIQNDHVLLERIIFSSKNKQFEIKTMKNVDDVFSKIKNDPKNIINNSFNISTYFNSSVHFWFNIYSKYDAGHVVIHDKRNIGIIYKVINFDELKKSSLNKFTRQSLQTSLTRKEVKKYKDAFGSPKNNEIKNNLYSKLDDLNIPPPSNKKEKVFFKKLAKNIRSQTGQKDSIKQAFINISPLYKNILKYFNYLSVPKELIAISFVESSFNPFAISKAGATGAWQFIKRTGKYFLPFDRNTDGRLNPILSSIAAAHLLRQNYKILKRWDLAVVAYNAGTKHLLKAQKKINGKKTTLKEIFNKYNHPHIGFAVKNYYNEFLALVYLISYRDKFKHLENEEIKSSFKISSNLNIYITKCSLRPEWLYNILKKSSPNIKYLNRHLLRPKKNYKKGTIIISDRNLTKRRYRKITKKDIINRYPKNWYKLVKNQSCSTR